MQHNAPFLHLISGCISLLAIDVNNQTDRKPKDIPEILELCRKGDRKAQKAIYDRLSSKMLSVCLRYVGDREVAYDMLQDGFVTLFTKLDQYLGEGSFEGWARKVFVNTCLAWLRKNDALKMSDDLDKAAGLASETATALEDIGYKDLMATISGLPPGFRTVFNMYVVEGYSHKEIAEELGISEVTSRTQLSRARTLLQEKLGKR